VSIVLAIPIELGKAFKSAHLANHFCFKLQLGML
jgi:hypothetical protein